MGITYHYKLYHGYVFFNPTCYWYLLKAATMSAVKATLTRNEQRAFEKYVLNNVKLEFPHLGWNIIKSVISF